MWYGDALRCKGGDGNVSDLGVMGGGTDEAQTYDPTASDWYDPRASSIERGQGRSEEPEGVTQLSSRDSVSGSRVEITNSRESVFY